MRSRVRDRQKVWFVTVTEKKVGIDTVQEYGKPIMKRMAVSATSGTPEELSAGIVPTYDKYITSYDRKFNPKEGDLVYVDIEPILDENGNLVMDSDGYTPQISPDYRIEKILDTKQGKVARYGISKIGGTN